MQLIRLYAFTVGPQRKSKNGVTPTGGAVGITDDLRNLINESITTANFLTRTSVVFNVDQQSRFNETREAILQICFSNSQEAEDAAIMLAKKLSRSMDNRSTPCLFIVAIMEQDDARRITLWTFPRDEAFRFGRINGVASIEILKDIFSRWSHLRKAAFFEGRNLHNEFLVGKVLDFQGGKTSDEVANYWLVAFLNCVLAMSTESGTRMLANSLKNAYDVCEEPNDHEQLFAAMNAIKHTARTRWTLEEFANQFLSGNAKTEFLKTIPNQESLVSNFDFDHEAFEKSIRFRVFRLENGVYVSSPPSEIGVTVQLFGTDERRLVCEGRILTDKIRIRHA